MECKVTIHTDFIDAAKVDDALENIKKIVSQALQREASMSDTPTFEDSCE